MPSTLLPKRWALTPPFHPYPHRVPFEDVPKVFLRAITGLRAAGGIFSVALSVNSSTGSSLCFFFAGPFRVPSRLHRLKSVLPPPWRYQAHCPSPSGLTAQGYSLLAQSGVRTFLPPSPLAAFQASDRPAHPPLLLYREIRPSHRRLFAGRNADYFTPSSFSNSPSVSTVTPSSLALSYFDPGSVPTTT